MIEEGINATEIERIELAIIPETNYWVYFALSFKTKGFYRTISSKVSLFRT